VRVAPDLLKVYMYNRGPEYLGLGLIYPGCTLVEIAGANNVVSFSVPLLSRFTGSMQITSFADGPFVPAPDPNQG
jgi:hypothetical protein